MTELTPPRDTTEPRTLRERVEALADEWVANADSLLKQGVIERAVRSTMVGCASALRAVLATPEPAESGERSCTCATDVDCSLCLQSMSDEGNEGDANV